MLLSFTVQMLTGTLWNNKTVTFSNILKFTLIISTPPTSAAVEQEPDQKIDIYATLNFECML